MEPSPNAFLIDGLNLMRLAPDRVVRLDNLLALVHELESRDYTFHCIFDANTRFLLFETGPDEEAIFLQLLASTEKYSVVTGGLRADDPLLSLCKYTGHRIISGDRYRREVREKHSWLTDEDRWLIKPHLAGDMMIVDELDIVAEVNVLGRQMRARILAAVDESQRAAETHYPEPHHESEAESAPSANQAAAVEEPPQASSTNHANEEVASHTSKVSAEPEIKWSFVFESETLPHQSLSPGWIRGRKNLSLAVGYRWILIAAGLLAIFLVGLYIYNQVRPNRAEHIASLREALRRASSNPVNGSYHLLTFPDRFIELEDYSGSAQAFEGFSTFSRAKYRAQQVEQIRIYVEFLRKAKVEGESLPSVESLPSIDERLNKFSRDQKIARELAELCRRVAANPSRRDLHKALGNKLVYYGYQASGQRELNRGEH